MERFELEPKLKEEIRARVLGEGFMKLVQTVRRNGKVFRISMRPVEIGGERKFQAEMTDDGQVQVKNLSANAAAEGLEGDHRPARRARPAPDDGEGRPSPARHEEGARARLALRRDGSLRDRAAA